LSWEPQMDGLAPLVRVIAWDLPGYGDSPTLGDERGPCALTFPLLADAVVELVDDVVGSSPTGPGVHLAGISFGGMIAQHAVARHPDRFASLTLMSTSPKFGLDGTTAEAWRAARLAPLDAGQEPADFAAAVLGRLAGPNLGPTARSQQIAAMSRVSGTALRRAIDCLVTHDSRSLLADIAVPTLVLVGELDTETPPSYAQYLADHIEGAELTVIEGAGHLLNAEAPDAVNELVGRHVSAHARRVSVRT
jgi:3-oxoadipate enol-lactonase